MQKEEKRNSLNHCSKYFLFLKEQENIFFLFIFFFSPVNKLQMITNLVIFSQKCDTLNMQQESVGG